MRNTKATPVSPFALLRAPAEIGLILLLGTFAACSSSASSTSASAEPQASRESRSLITNPYANKTPAQRRAEWLKRQPDVQPASATSDMARKPTVSSN